MARYTSSGVPGMTRSISTQRRPLSSFLIGIGSSSFRIAVFGHRISTDDKAMRPSACSAVVEIACRKLRDCPGQFGGEGSIAATRSFPVGPRLSFLLRLSFASTSLRMSPESTSLRSRRLTDDLSSLSSSTIWPAVIPGQASISIRA